MRLLDTTTLRLHEVHGDCTEPYAILSHTWGEEECTLRDMASPDVVSRQGFAKIKHCCEQAARDGLKWVWVDTCCIDKTSTAELTEAINSMFRWYRQAEICYAYLADVIETSQLAGSRWFTRGWTLQELIAPKVVQFFSSTWAFLGAKNDTAISNQIREATGIELSVLLTGVFHSACVARRMSWAANRQTTRVEDGAYCLMGLFGVNMPLIYGEGKKAFLRLQQHVLMETEDLSILAWGMPPSLDDVDSMAYHASHAPRLGPFAESASAFSESNRVAKVHITKFQDPTPPTVVGAAVTIHAGVLRQPMGIYLVIPCTTTHHPDSLLAIPVTDWGSHHYERSGPLRRVSINEDTASDMMEVVSFRQQPRVTEAIQRRISEFRLFRIPNPYQSSAVVLENILQAPSVAYSQDTFCFKWPDTFEGVVGALTFVPSPRLAEVQRHVRILEEDKLCKFAIILAFFGKPRFALVQIADGSFATGESLSKEGTLSHCKMTYEQLQSYISGKMDQPEELRFAYAYQGQSLLRAVHSLPKHGLGIKRAETEHLKIIMRVVLMTAPVDYLNKSHFLCLDIAGQMSCVVQNDLKVRGGINKSFTKPDWQLIGIQRGFQPVLADLNDRPEQWATSLCRERWCLVCSFGPRGSGSVELP